MNPNGLYIALLSVHGLIRADAPELGRDADTGGQITYVLELARTLIQHPKVAQVDLFTRRIFDRSIGNEYSHEVEPLGPHGGRIVRISCGPRRYLRKELLWPYLDSFVDSTVSFLRRQRHTPHLFHSHYADAGYVGHELSRFLGIPLVHTGHSLGRSKRERLLAGGASPDKIERQYKLRHRIDAEERVLEHADWVICSTRQEADEQWSTYENAYNTRLVVIPPGTDTTRFLPPKRGWRKPPIQASVDRFLARPHRPMILALARPDPRKNLRRLVMAYAQSPSLRRLANLVIVAGNRDDVRTLEEPARSELTQIMLDIDRYDLYGQIAMPKHHTAADVPDLYRLAVRRRGVFVNPALTEPFGLTLIEAAASGVPIVATDDGGPRDIIGNCNNGYLIDGLNPADIAAKIEAVLAQRERWRRLSEAGRSGVRRHYTWNAHVNRYVKEITTMIDRLRPRGLSRKRTEAARQRLLQLDRMLVCDIDDTLVGDDRAMAELITTIKRHRHRLAFVVATGRSLTLTQAILAEKQLPTPDVLITSVGTAIHEGPHLDPADGWTRHLREKWQREGVEAALDGLPGLELQSNEGQQTFKVSYFVDGGEAVIEQVKNRLREAGLRFTAAFSHGRFLDILPLRASKGKAIRYLADKWEIPLQQVLVAGDSGNDEEMLRGGTLGVVVGNFSPELAPLKGQPGIYFAEKQYAAGILEGMTHYGFLNP